MTKKHLNPERVVLVLILLFGVVTYALLVVGYVFGRPSFYRWAIWTGAATVAVAFIPLVGFAIVVLIERLRRNRRL